MDSISPPSVHFFYKFKAWVSLVHPLIGWKPTWIIFFFCIFQVTESMNIVMLHSFVTSYIILQQQLFVFCYLGQIITSKLPEVGEAMFAASWYEYSVKYRCHIVMVILRSQRSVILKGYGFLPCTLMNFKEVRNHSNEGFRFAELRLSFLSGEIFYSSVMFCRCSIWPFLHTFCSKASRNEHIKIIENCKDEWKNVKTQFAFIDFVYMFHQS